MSVPGNINSAPPPSSFDDDAEFYEESRWKKLQRKIFEEPLIPLGCGLTVWALYEATRSIRTGNKERTNRMFRRRIYAQGFTILAMFAGSIYWEKDRSKRKQYDGLVEEKKKREKHDAWLRELEIRDDEERELRKMRAKIEKGQMAERKKLSENESRAAEKKIKEDQGQAKGVQGNVKSVLENGESRRGPILVAARRLWEDR